MEYDMGVVETTGTSDRFTRDDSANRESSSSGISANAIYREKPVAGYILLLFVSF